MYVYTYTCTYSYIDIYIYIYICPRIGVYACLDARVQIWIFVCIYIYMYVLYTNLSIIYHSIYICMLYILPPFQVNILVE